MAETSAFQFEKIEATDKPKALSSSLYQGAEKAFLTCEGECRFRYDGQDPTSSEGHHLRDGAHLILKGICQIQSFRFINCGEPAILQVSYER